MTTANRVSGSSLPAGKDLTNRHRLTSPLVSLGGDFEERVVQLYDQSLSDAGSRRMKIVERARIKSDAAMMKCGKVENLGLSRGETWTVDDVLVGLGIKEPEAA